MEARKVSGNCAGVPCQQLWRKVSGGWNDVRITEVLLTALDWNSGNPVPGSEVVADLSSLHSELLFRIRDELGLTRWDGTAEGRVVDYGACQFDCYCDIPADTQPSNETQHQEQFEWQFDYVQVVWMSRLEVNGQFQFWDPGTGKPVAPQPHQQVEGPVQMNPGVSMAESWKLLTKYRAKVKARVKYIKYELNGICNNPPVEGGFPV